MFLNSYAIPNLICFAGLIALASFVFRKRSGSSVGLAYLVLCLSAAAWQIGTFFVLCSKSEELALLFCRLTYLGSLFIPATTYHFVISALGEEPRRSRVLWTIYLTWFLIFLPLSQTPWFITGVYHFFWGYWWRSGLPHAIFLLALSLVLSLTFYKLISRIKTAPSSIEKKRRQYLFLGLLIAYIGAIDYAPNYGVEVYPFGFIPIYLHLSIYAYAIVRYKFLDIEVIIRKTLVFTGVVAAAACAISLPLALVQLIVGRVIGIPPFWLMVLGIGTTVFIYRPIERRLVHLTDRYLFQKKTNYRILLKEASQYLAHVESLKKQARRIVSFLIKKARIANVSLYVFTSSDPSGLGLKASRPIVQDGQLKEIKLTHPIIQHLYQDQGPIDGDRLSGMIQSEQNLGRRSQLEEISGLMKSLRSSAVIPCFGGEAAATARKVAVHLRGVLFLGPQKSDEPYTEEDLDVFFTLGQESSIAFENARLYDEAIERARELVQINQQLNDAQTKLLRALKEQESANQELRVTQAALIVAQKKAAMVGMAQAIGHEVYNPLSPVSGWAQLIYMFHIGTYREILNKYRRFMSEDDIKKFEKRIQETDHYSRAIQKNSGRIEGVVRTLTGTLKASSGEMRSLNFRVFLQQHVLEAARFTTGEENLSGCEVRLNITPNLEIFGNEDQLEQVFLNLIKNAYEAMAKQENRRLDISAALDPENPDMARIEFSDNGRGIPPEVLPKIWTQGFSTKLKKGESLGASGQGQGLFVCKHIIETFHKGLIIAKSVVGQGTTFTIKLPLGPGKEGER